MRGRGTFYTFEISKENIMICKELCKDYDQHINYVEGDSVQNLKRMVEENVLDRVHFAFFDSVNDAAHIWGEFKAVESLFKRNSIVIVDDALWGKKGELIKPHLEGSAEWKTKLYNVENGILVAKKVC